MRPFVSSIRYVSEEVNSQFSGFVCLQSSIFFHEKLYTSLYKRLQEVDTFYDSLNGQTIKDYQRITDSNFENSGGNNDQNGH